MTLPEDFSPAEHLQDVVKNVQNRLVRAEFSDLGDEAWEPNIGTSRASLRVACTHLDDDSIDMTLTRLWLFFGCLRKAKDFHPDVYGRPAWDDQAIRKHKPQIKLFFREDFQHVEPGFDAVEGEITVRIMAETEQTFSKADAERYANRIKSLFGSSGGFTWKKGKTMVSYTEKIKGYQLQLLCRNEAEGKRVIEQVLDMQSHTPNWKFLNVSNYDEPTVRFPTLPPMEQIYGKARRLPRERPIADVRFRRASIHLWGMPNAILLVDADNHSSHALVH
jgi:hypothetical protein